MLYLAFTMLFFFIIWDVTTLITNISDSLYSSVAHLYKDTWYVYAYLIDFLKNAYNIFINSFSKSNMHSQITTQFPSIISKLIIVLNCHFVWTKAFSLSSTYRILLHCEYITAGVAGVSDQVNSSCSRYSDEEITQKLELVNESTTTPPMASVIGWLGMWPGTGSWNPSKVWLWNIWKLDSPFIWNYGC